MWNARLRQPRPRRSNQAERSGAEEIVPDRLVAQGCDKIPMCQAIGLCYSRCPRQRTVPPRHFTGSAGAGIAGFTCQDQLRLPGPDQVDVNLGQKLGVEQRAVLGTAGIVDRIPRGEIIETGRYARMLWRAQ